MLRMRLRRGAAAAAWCCGCGVEGVEHGSAWSTEARAAGEMAARARVMAAAGGAERVRGWRGVEERRRRTSAVAARAHGGGVEERRRRKGKAAWRRRRRREMSRAKQRGKRGGGVSTTHI